MGLILLATIACTPTNPSPSRLDDVDAAPARIGQGRTAVFMSHVEPPTLSQHRALTGTGSVPSDAIRLFNASLFTVDDRAVPQPYLAETAPQLNTESWKVFSDGRMETTYTLRQGAQWHDGTPLTAEDFVLSWRIQNTPEMGVADLLPMRVMEDVAAVDARTMLVRWSQSYPQADALAGRDWAPAPQHIVGHTFAAAAGESMDTFANHPYWTREYVGAGPFRLERWEPGAFMAGVAFDGHVWGRPNIDRIQVLFVSDPNTAVAHLLAGEAHVSVDFTLSFEQGPTLRREWASQIGGSVLFSPDKLRYVTIQFKPEYASPREILDVRVRQALAHAIDKQGFVDGLLDGEGHAAETMVPPTVDYYSEVQRVITSYPYDLRMTEQLMAETGATKGPDGFSVTASGERFSPELRATAGGQTEREQAILADGWRRSGLDVRSRTLSPAEDADRETRSTFPAFATANTGLEEPTLMVKLYSPNAATAARRWAGSNRGGWNHPEYDRLYDILTTNLDPRGRIQAVVQAMKLVNDELPMFPLYYNYLVAAHVAAIQGPNAYAPGGSGTWNVHEWAWRS